MNNIALIQSLINENAEAHLEKEVPVIKTMLVKYYEDDDKVISHNRNLNGIYLTYDP